MDFKAFYGKPENVPVEDAADVTGDKDSQIIETDNVDESSAEYEQNDN